MMKDAQLSRREVLRTLAALPLGAQLLACGDGDPQPGATDTAIADTAADDDTAATDTLADDTAMPADTALPDDTTMADTTPSVCDPTLPDAEGPFFVENAPETTKLAAVGEPGQPISMRGVVRGVDCAFIAGAVIEVWQADDEGEYNDDKLRGTLIADAEGAFAFESIRPAPYGDVGGFRPAHFHYKVTAPGFRTVTTQIYFAGDEFLSPNDSCGGCGSDDEARIVALDTDDWGQHGEVDIVLEPV